MKRCYIDVETTGTDHQVHGIIQWSAKMAIGSEIVDQIDLNMQPFLKDEISDDALEANHIAKEELYIEERLVPRAAYKEIINFLSRYISKFDRKDKCFFVGFNGKFDADFTRKFFEKNGDMYFGSFFWYPILDVAILAGYLLQKERTNMKDFKLRTVYEFLHQDDLTLYDDTAWHDSQFDIDRTIDIEKALRKRVMASR